MWRNDWLGEGTGEPEMNLSQREVCVARRWIAHSTGHIQILPAPKQPGQELEAACCTGGEKQRMIVSGDERQGEYGKQPVEELPPSFFPGARACSIKRGHPTVVMPYGEGDIAYAHFALEDQFFHAAEISVS